MLAVASRKRVHECVFITRLNNPASVARIAQCFASLTGINGPASLLVWNSTSILVAVDLIVHGHPLQESENCQQKRVAADLLTLA